MQKTLCRVYLSYLFILVTLVFTLPGSLLAQPHLRGKVIFKRDSKPAAAATVSLTGSHGGNSMHLTDKSGNFSVPVRDIRAADSVMISLVGYYSIRIPVAQAMEFRSYELVENTKNLEPVKVFSSQGMVGDTKESVGYFMSWSADRKGGEIGRIVHFPYKEYKIDKIRFKVNNRCDTTIIRLHIREVVDGKPGPEIFGDSIAVMVKKYATIDDKATEFDLSERNIILKKREVFIGLEVLSTKSKTPGQYCSFSFAGSEKGEYSFKSSANEEWEPGHAEYTIFLRASIRY